MNSTQITLQNIIKEEISKCDTTGKIKELIFRVYLIYFLKKNGILNKYLSNCIASKNKGKISIFVDEYTITRYPSLMVAFTWKDTPEGYRYWCDYYKKFEDGYRVLAYKYHL